MENPGAAEQVVDDAIEADGATGTITSVSRSATHDFSKAPVASIRLITGWGIEGDAHAGHTAQHVYIAKKDPTRANLTQVHLLPEEVFAEVAALGHDVTAGGLGENVTTRGLVLRTLPLGTRLHLGADAIVEVTGLRSPCSQINRFQKGLMKALIAKDAADRVIRKAGIMSVVVADGVVYPDDEVRVELPAGEFIPLGTV
ncbi:MOSC domain-containing protein [Glaciihabitans sp. dw_435]|uniref:MOSC domain-containing protein n=1 Tax=Glaciihabitans sp. dw_435 TaxID=2720081 RepID=UPI001C4A54EA|nr:MOSC domain-containing protein [Glaciihabitans sp. dw_435]